MNIDVIDSQPCLVLESSSLAQSVIILSEGETKNFSLTVRNISHTVAADLILVSFIDSITSQMQDEMANKDISGTEMYELELNSAQKPVFRLQKSADALEFRISPNDNLTLEIEVLGKRGLTHGNIQVDYSFLGVAKSDLQDRFFTRQLNIPLAVTVNASLILTQCDIHSLPDNFGASTDAFLRSGSNDQRVFSPGPEISRSIPASASSLPNSLLLLDFSNSWTATLTMKITSRASQPTSESHPYSFECPIHPGATVRIPVTQRIGASTASPQHISLPPPSVKPAKLFGIVKLFYSRSLRRGKTRPQAAPA